MNRQLITICAALFFLLLHMSYAYPALQQQQEDEEEDESLEENQAEQLNKVLANHFGLGGNSSDQAIVEKATSFLAQYFSGGSSAASALNADEDSLPPKQNRTIIITIVDSKNNTEGINAAELNLESLGLSRSPTGISSASQLQPVVNNNNAEQGQEALQGFESTVPSSSVSPISSNIAPAVPPSDINQLGQSGTNNIEDAIHEALTVVQQPGNSGLPGVSVSGQQLQLIPAIDQVGSIPLEQNSAQGAPIIFVSQYIPPVIPSTTVRTAPSIFGTFSKIVGSISQGNLGGAIQNSFKLVEVPEIQDSAKLAVGGVLHTLATGVSSGLQTGLASGITSGLTSGIQSGLTNNRIGGDLATGISSGAGSGVLNGIVNGVNCQVLQNCPTLPPPSTIFRNVPDAYKSIKAAKDE